MTSQTVQIAPREPSPYPTRFSWKMRFFLAVLVFGLTYRCFSILFPTYEWADQFSMARLPLGLPSPLERKELRAAAKPDDPDPVMAAWGRTGLSILDFWKPWPGPESRGKLQSPADALKFGAAWINTRLTFLERIVGLNEQFMMFAPSVVKNRVNVRPRLFYDDGTDRIDYQRTDPGDYTHYSIWFLDRVGSMEYQAGNDDSYCWGYCNLLAHRHPTNDNGAHLVHILLYCVDVWMPAPWEDAMAHYKNENLLTRDPPLLPDSYRLDLRGTGPPWRLWNRYEFDVETGVGARIPWQEPE